MMKTFLSFLLLGVLWVVLAGCDAKNQPPTATIVSPENNSRTNELNIAFVAEVDDPDGQVETITWSFGDGIQQGGGTEVNHTYKQGGEYTVHLTVADAQGETGTAAVRVSINQQPAAAARAQLETEEGILPFVKAINGEAPIEIVFDGGASSDSDGTVAGYHWDFGDGTTSTDPNPSHTYQTLGEYEAVLTVTDDEGQTSQDRVLINVKPRPVNIAEFLNTEAETPEYTLIRGSTIGTDSAQKSVLYSYETTPEGPFSREEVKLGLLDAAFNLAQHPGIGRVTIYLFTEPKAGFMDPGDFDHYLGMLEWQRPESDEDLADHVINNSYLGFNDNYFDGTAPTLTGFKLHQTDLDPEDPLCTICDNSRVVLINLVLSPEPDNPDPLAPPPPLCHQQAVATLQAVLQRALMAPGGYALNVYEGQLGPPNGVALGLWSTGGADLSKIPTESRLFFQPVDAWEIDSDTFKLTFTEELPDCDVPVEEAGAESPPTEESES